LWINKTDVVDGSSIGLRADEYRPQMKLYRQAIQRNYRKIREGDLPDLPGAEQVVRL